MRRLGHTAILLGFSAPVACAAGVVAFFALAAAPLPPPVPDLPEEKANASAQPAIVAVPLPTPEIPAEVTAPPAEKASPVDAVAQAPAPLAPAAVAPAPETPALMEAASMAPAVPAPALAENVVAPSPAAGPAVEVAAQSPAQAPESPVSPDVAQITIKAGNSLWSISRDIYGSGRHYLTLLNANRGKISDPRLIYPGQVLAAPKKMED